MATGLLDATVRAGYVIAAHPTLVDAASLSGLFGPFGTIDDNSIVISLGPSPPKKLKRVTALVLFKQIGSAFAAVCSSGRTENVL